MKNILVHTLMIVFLCTCGKSAFSQVGGSGLYGGEKGTVSGTGIVTIEKKPQVMRMQIDILSKAGSLKEALTGLKDQIAAARAQLAVLGADKKTIKISPPQISSTKSERQQQIEMMLSQRMQSRGKGNAKKKKATTGPITVSAQLTAEWKLQTQNTEELLLAVHPLQNKIKEADLAGLNAASKLTPEEQELMEEMEEASSSYYSSDREAKPGEPVFSFASPISKEEEDKAMAEAFKIAKSQAARLAKAANSQLGKLSSISSDSASASDEDSEYRYNSAYYVAAQRMRSARNSGDSQIEAISVLPKKVKYRVTVFADFELKEK